MDGVYVELDQSPGYGTDSVYHLATQPPRATEGEGLYHMATKSSGENKGLYHMATKSPGENTAVVVSGCEEVVYELSTSHVRPVFVFSEESSAGTAEA